MIGVFDSGLGGLSILKEIRRRLPEYDYLYLGDNARAPYGTRSFEVVYEYTLQAVRYLFSKGCTLVILACNTASAKALRTIQQNDLPLLWKEAPSSLCAHPDLRRVLGIIRPTAEEIGSFTKTGHVGVLATQGTVSSDSYPIEISKQNPQLVVVQQACPMWVPLVEQNEHTGSGADYFVDKYIREIMQQDPQIDTLLLGCTHYPLLYEKIEKAVASYASHPVQVVAQGAIIAESLAQYLVRHSDLEKLCSKQGKTVYLTTDRADSFAASAEAFLGEKIAADHVEIS